VVNWLFAIPAVYTGGTFGRRNLLPAAPLCRSSPLLYFGFSCGYQKRAHKTARIACRPWSLTGAVYSPGEGPVAVHLSAETHTLSMFAHTVYYTATATTWFFNFVLSITLAFAFESI